MEKTIKVFGRRRYTKQGHKAFYAYSYTKDGKIFFRVKFRQECHNIPTGGGYYLLTIDTSKVTIQHFADHPEWNAVIWLEDIVNCKADTESNEAMQKKALEEVSELF